MDENEIVYLKKHWRKKPKELVRRFMLLLVGREKLEKMTPTGRAKTSAIPKDIFEAVLNKSRKKLIYICQL